jgi:hypothetical protein
MHRARLRVHAGEFDYLCHRIESAAVMLNNSAVLRGKSPGSPRVGPWIGHVGASTASSEQGGESGSPLVSDGSSVFG